MGVLLPYLFRLVPGNPILLRVVQTAGKKHRDLVFRCVYLGLLVGLVLLSLLANSSGLGGSNLAGLAKVSSKIFQQLSYLQLGLVALLAPVFTAGAITQERDSQTYDILLATPLTNGQILLGSLLSRVFFVIALLLSGVPVFSVTQIFGGVAISAIATSFLIAASTALVTGALAMAIATLKVGNRRTIFSFYLFIVVYVVGGILADSLGIVHPTDVNGQPISTSWLTGLHPFLALRTIFHEPGYLPPDIAELPAHLRFWPIGWYLTNPAGFYIWATTLASLAMITPSVVLLRRLAQGTLIPRGWLRSKLRKAPAPNEPGQEIGARKARTVWNNPIAWREARTKGSAARATLLRWTFLTIGLGLALAGVVVGGREIAPKQYILPSSYDGSAQTVTVFGARAVTYYVPPVATIQRDAAELDLRRVGRQLEVTTLEANGQTLSKLVVTAPRMLLDSARARQLLLGAILVEATVILLVVTNAAASTVTREKEDGTLDLLLTTPITSRYYLWGKLRGLVYFVLPLIAVPVISVAVFVGADLLSRLATGETRWGIHPEAPVVIGVTLVIVASFAAIIGMDMSLRCRTTVRAVMASVGIVAGVCGALGWCGFSLLGNTGRGPGPAVAVASFSPFTSLALMVDPKWLAGGSLTANADDVLTTRILATLFSLAAAGVYAGVVWTMYRAMVKNFDMTIRRQSR